MLGNGNTHVFFDCLRSQGETLAFLHDCTLKPDYIQAATTGSRNATDKESKISNILTMIEKVDKFHKGLQKDYDQLSNLIHPNPESLYANFQIIDEKKKVVALTTRLPKMPNNQATIHLRILIMWTKWIFDETLRLLEVFYGKNENDR